MELQELLRGYALYHRFLPSQVNRLRCQQIAALRQSYPRLAFELGFLIGKVDLIEEARSLRRDVQPQQEVSLTLLARGDYGKVMLIQHEFQKSADEVSWQKWRLEGIVDGQMDNSFFMPYNQSEVVCNVPERGVLFSNSYLERGNVMVVRGTPFFGKAPAITGFSEQLSVEAMFRYATELIFYRKLSHAQYGFLRPH